MYRRKPISARSKMQGWKIQELKAKNFYNLKTCIDAKTNTYVGVKFDFIIIIIIIIIINGK